MKLSKGEKMPATEDQRELFSKRFGKLGDDVLGSFCHSNPLDYEPDTEDEECTCSLYIEHAERVAEKLQRFLPSVRTHIMVIKECVAESFSELPEEEFKKLDPKAAEAVALYIKIHNNIK